MAVITISKQFGTGGKALGEMIANELGYAFADSFMIQLISKKANASVNWVREFEIEAGGRIKRLIANMVAQKIDDNALKDKDGNIDEDVYLDHMVLIISQIADEGDCVVMGRGSQYILKNQPDVYNILIIDEFESRVESVMNEFDISEEEAVALVKKKDLKRIDLYNKLGKSDYNNSELYHLVINLEKLDNNKALKLICDLVNG